MAAHVESGGAKGHFTHDDATCAACQARSIAGATAVPAPARIAHTHVDAIAVATIDRVHWADVHLQEKSRAPPVVS